MLRDFFKRDKTGRDEPPYAICLKCKAVLTMEEAGKGKVCPVCGHNFCRYYHGEKIGPKEDGLSTPQS